MYRSRVSVFAACALAIAPSLLVAQDAKALLGRWESVETSRGGIGEMIEFSDRHVVSSPGAIVRGTWRADGNRLTLAGPQTHTRSFEIRGDTMVAWMEGRPDTIRMVRTAASTSRTGIVGEWAYPARVREGLTAYETFRADSTHRIWIPFRRDSAEYSAAGGRIETRGPGSSSEMFFRLSDAGLELQRATPNGTQTRLYARERQ